MAEVVHSPMPANTRRQLRTHVGQTLGELKGMCQELRNIYSAPTDGSTKMPSRSQQYQLIEVCQQITDHCNAGILGLAELWPLHEIIAPVDLSKPPGPERVDTLLLQSDELQQSIIEYFMDNYHFLSAAIVSRQNGVVYVNELVCIAWAHIQQVLEVLTPRDIWAEEMMFYAQRSNFAVLYNIARFESPVSEYTNYELWRTFYAFHVASTAVPYHPDLQELFDALTKRAFYLLTHRLPQSIMDMPFLRRPVTDQDDQEDGHDPHEGEGEREGERENERAITGLLDGLSLLSADPQQPQQTKRPQLFVAAHPFVRDLAIILWSFADRFRTVCRFQGEKMYCMHETPPSCRILFSELCYLMDWVCRESVYTPGHSTASIYTMHLMRVGAPLFYLRECGQAETLEPNVILETMYDEVQTMRITEDAQRSPLTVLNQYANGRPDETALTLALVHKMASRIMAIDQGLAKYVDDLFIVSHPTIDEVRQPELAAIETSLGNVRIRDCPVLIRLFNTIALYTKDHLVMYPSVTFAMVGWLREVAFHHDYSVLGSKVRYPIVDQIFDGADLTKAAGGMGHQVAKRILSMYADSRCLYVDYNPYETNMRSKGRNPVFVPDQNMVHDRPAAPPPPSTVAVVQTHRTTLGRRLAQITFDEDD